MKKYILGFLIGIFLAIPVFAYSAPSLSTRLKGRILLQVESKGEAWFVKNDGTRVYIGSPLAAWEILRKFALGISNKNLTEIPLADEAYTMNEEVSRGYQSFVKKETVYVDRIIEKPIDKIVYVDRQTSLTVPAEKVNNPANNFEVVDPPKPTPTLSVKKGKGATVTFKATGDDFVIEALSVQSDKTLGVVDLGTLQLRECASLNSLWLEYSGIPYPIECVTQGYYQTDWMGRTRTDAIRVNSNQTLETNLTDNGIIKYLRAVGVNTGTIITLRDIK